MQALILAGGQGTRLRPHTEAIPKPLLPLGGKTILDHQIDTLRYFDIQKITLVTGYFSEKIHAHLGSVYPGQPFSFVHNDEFEHSRPAYAIIKALPTLLGEDCIYLNGDVLYDRRILERIIATKTSSTAIQRSPWDEEQVKVILDQKNHILHLSKNIPKEEGQGEFIGVSKLTKELLTSLEKIAGKEGLETFRYAFAIDLLDHAIHQDHQIMEAVDVTDLPAIEIDTPSDYENAFQTFTVLETSSRV